MFSIISIVVQVIDIDILIFNIIREKIIIIICEVDNGFGFVVISYLSRDVISLVISLTKFMDKNIGYD